MCMFQFYMYNRYTYKTSSLERSGLERSGDGSSEYERSLVLNARMQKVRKKTSGCKRSVFFFFSQNLSGILYQGRYLFFFPKMYQQFVLVAGPILAGGFVGEPYNIVLAILFIVF